MVDFGFDEMGLKRIWAATIKDKQEAIKLERLRFKILMNFLMMKLRMKIDKNHKMKLLAPLLILSFIQFTSCETDQDRLEKAEKECAGQTKIDGFPISFYGYFPEDADSINIKVKRNGKFTLDYDDLIPQKISDSLRHQRNYFVKNEILLTDTVFVRVKGEAVKTISDFRYSIRPHFTMMSKNWGCDFHELKVDGTVIEGATVMFIRKDSKWQSIDRHNYKNYYLKKN